MTTFDFNDPTGTLLKYSDGTSTAVNVTITADNVEPWNPNGMPNEGTDAYNIFNGIVNINEIASYSSSSIDWYYEIMFSGLDPAKEYEFITTANRNNVSYDGSGISSRWTKFTITGADTYINISSTGVTAVSEDVLKMNTGYNTENGYVVAWSGISASDGSFTVRSVNVGVEGPGEQYKSYGFQGFVFKELD